MIYYILFFSASLLISLALTPIVRRSALFFGQVAVPKDNRWHKKETALLGGISIFFSISVAWTLGVLWLGWYSWGEPLLPMVICCSAMFGLGLVDDIYDIAPQHKLAGQIIIVSVLVFFGFKLGWTESDTINLILSIVWLVGITNAFNLLDNMDGLSAGIAFIAGAFLFAFVYINKGSILHAEPVLVICAVYLGAILGFLVYNFNPASIFMGDAGSLFIGFVLASLTVKGTSVQIQGGSFFNLVSVIAIPVLILFIPILDTGFVSIMRKFFRRKISQGGKDHSSHRMVAIGISEKKAVTVLYGFAVIAGMVALAINYLGAGVSLLIVVFYCLFVAFFWIYLARVKVYKEESILSTVHRGPFTPLIIEITYKRRLFEVLLDFVLITVAYYSAYLLRFENNIGDNFDFFLKSLPIMIASQILFFYLSGIYRGVWESTGVRDLIGYVKAITAGTVLTVLILLGIYRFESFSRAVFAIYWIIMLILVSLSRLSFRLLDEGIKKGGKTGLSTLIYGAGVGGQMVMKEIETNKALGLKLVGFLDDNSKIHGRKIHGYPVWGRTKDLEKIIKEQNIQKIIVSFREEGEEKKRELIRYCSQIGMEVDVKRMKFIIS